MGPLTCRGRAKAHAQGRDVCWPVPGTLTPCGDFVGGAIFDELKGPGNVDRRHAADCTFDAITVRIIDKAGRRATADGGGCPLGAIRVIIGEGGGRRL